MTMTELREDLRVVFDSGPGQAYLLRQGDRVVLVDTGIAGQGPAIEASLEDWGLDRAAVSHLLLTHWHPDHAGSAAEIAAWPNAKVWAHRADAPIIRGEVAGTFPCLSHAEEGLYAQISGTVPDAAASRVDRELEDAETLADIGATVLSVPGHTDGSIAVHFEQARVLFTGDVATENGGFVILGPFNQDRVQARTSFRRFADIDVDTVCFGHGTPLQGQDTLKLREAASAGEVPDPLA